MKVRGKSRADVHRLALWLLHQGTVDHSKWRLIHPHLLLTLIQGQMNWNNVGEKKSFWFSAFFCCCSGSKLSMASDFMWWWHVVLVDIFAAFLDSTVEKLKRMKRFLEFTAILGAFSSQVFCIFHKNSTSGSENMLELWPSCIRAFIWVFASVPLRQNNCCLVATPTTIWPPDVNAPAGSHVHA